MADDGNGRTETMRIMIVEDNEALAQTTGWLVEMIGYDYKLAANAKQAIDTYAEYKPDVFMIDIGLPGMNGYDLCRELKSRPDLKNAVFIAQTGWGESEHRRMTAEAGFDHHMVKPLYLEALETLLGDIAKQKTGSA
ncbi:response regulator [Asticcacaulis sp. 201]|uniref:response regulator n=1 Tax=Asticcacaulis sp. 201 TaxID=3028787 RepID=UPI0029170FBC|nr:response regulator [Asticcacaulis sp. 201]MDV6332266.1 response regulator [Asticcacaulis sp. 201]